MELNPTTKVYKMVSETNSKLCTYTISWATGIEDGRLNPVKVKKHGYPQYSVFRRGLNLRRAFFENKILDPINRTLDLALSRLELIQKIIG